MFNIAMVGAGAIANVHKKVLCDNGSFKIVAVCDINEENGIVTAEQGLEIVDVLERIITCIHG